jgi:hypothetical protein
MAELHPKNLVPLTAWEHDATFEDTLTLFGAGAGDKPLEIPLDELERYAARPFGAAIFSRAVDKFGKPIPLTNRCSYCHSGPLGTNNKLFDVGTRRPTDDSGLLDTPQLIKIALTAPYLHDGSAATLEEIWTIYNLHDQHGRTNDLTKDELNDLIEYLRSRWKERDDEARNQNALDDRGVADRWDADICRCANIQRFRFENFTTANGLPNNHVFAVLVDGDRIRAGTGNGLGLYENGKWKTYTTKDGLAHRAVLSLALGRRTGDVCAGTMGGLSRISGGRIDSFTHLSSGLSSNVVYGVSVKGENIWVATAAGACRLNLRTGQWSLYNERNTPMSEIWVYGVSATPTEVYYAVWGGGMLEYDQKTGVWDKYEDPDDETAIVFFKDQGLIHQIVSSVRYVDNILWVATYFGDCRYDHRYWHNFLTKDSGLPSNFTNVCEGRGRKSRLVLHRQGAGLLRRR